MSRIVDALVDRGLITRVVDPRDRRSVRIAATAEGGICSRPAASAGSTP